MITGIYTLDVDSTETTSLTQAGTLGTRSYTATENSTMTTESSASGNSITSQVATTASSTDAYSYQKETTYSDGSDTQSVTRSGESSSQSDVNMITGVFVSSRSGEQSEAVTESGDRAGTYQLSTSSSIDYNSEEI